MTSIRTIDLFLIMENIIMDLIAIGFLVFIIFVLKPKVKPQSDIQNG